MRHTNEAGAGGDPLSTDQSEQDQGAGLREIVFKELIPAFVLEIICYLLLWAMNYLEIHLPITAPADAPWWHHTNADHFFLWVVHFCVGLVMAIAAVLYILRPITRPIWVWISKKRKWKQPNPLPNLQKEGD